MKEASQNSDDNKNVTKLVAKLIDVLRDLGTVAKKARNVHFNYMYVSEGQMMAELRGRLSERNVFFTTSVETMRVQYGEAKAGVFAEVTTKHTFYDAETGASLTVGGAGVGWDSGDKGIYKAITGATKYALMKNFMVTDEQDPEAGEQRAAGKSGHKPTRRYEEETDDSPHAAGDLVQLKAFLTEAKIPEAFLLSMLKEKKMVAANLQHIANAEPGVIRRCLSPKSQENLINAYKNSETEKTETEKPKAAKDPLDQRRMDVRKLADPTIDPVDLLEQEGHDNWRTVPIGFGKQKGTKLGKLSAKSLVWWITEWAPKKYRGAWSDEDILLDCALHLAHAEMADTEARGKGE